MNSKTKAQKATSDGIPLLDLTEQNRILRQELDAAIARVLDHGHFINGPEIVKLENEIARYCGAAHAVAVSSGTDALLIALMAIDLKPRDEVITSVYSFFATAGVVARLGATPVFVDIDPHTFNLDTAAVKKAVTKSTKAVIPVHLFGQCADMQPILETAGQYGLRVIEDAAQAIGAQYHDGRRAGSLGDLGCFSFFPSKNLGALGDGGMVVTNDGTLAERLRILRNHGSKPKYYHQYIGGNFRLDTLQAAALQVKLPHLDTWIHKRQENAARYEKLFSANRLDKVLTIPAAIYQDSGVRHYHIYNQFVVRLPKRDRVLDFFRRESVGAEIYYPVPFHLQKCFQSLSYKPGDFPAAEKAAAEALAIPIFPEITAEQQARVVSVLASALQSC